MEQRAALITLRLGRNASLVQPSHFLTASETKRPGPRHMPAAADLTVPLWPSLNQACGRYAVLVIEHGGIIPEGGKPAELSAAEHRPRLRPPTTRTPWIVGVVPLIAPPADPVPPYPCILRRVPR